MSVLRSRDNPRVRRWAKLARDGSLRRKEGRAIIEGPHLVAEVLAAGLQPLAMLASESGLERDEIRELTKKFQPVVLGDSAFRSIADADNPPGVAAEIAIPEAKLQSSRHCVFLEGVQDPANVGAILRSAAAFGVGEVVLDRACADAWSPKALRAGMGGHFRLHIRSAERLEEALQHFDGKVVCAVARGGVQLREADLRGRLGWIFGGEGQGVSEAIARRANLQVTIQMAPDSESLNVAAAAAICLYQAFSRFGAGSAARAGS
jgi:RNA methyltransferase, TrmH family